MEQQTLAVTANFVSPEERMRLMQLCLGMTGNIDAAEDLVQETLLEAWQHLNARLTVVSDYETYKILRIDGGGQ